MKETNNLDMYAAYLMEQESTSLYETDKGFLTYRYGKDEEIGSYVYIIDIYVKPEHRKEGVASKMADKIAAIAKSDNVTKMIGSVELEGNNPIRSEEVLLAYGMKPLGYDGSLYYYIKEI